MAPVNPEGQTARDVIEAAKRLARKDYIAWGDAGGPNQCSHNRAAGVPCPWCDLATVVCCDIDKILPTQPSEGQTPQEVRRAALEEAAERVQRQPWWRDSGQAAAAIRALASTPSQIQTQSTKEEHGGRDRSGAAQHRAFSGGGDAEHAGDGTPRFEADRTERQVLRADEQSGVHSVRARAAGVCEADREVAPSPAKQEQKIASAEGAASQLGAAPATSPGSELHGLIVGGSVKADPAYSAAAQPDARDAESGTAGQMSPHRALAMFAASNEWLRQRIGRSCPCGHCWLCAYNALRGLTKELEEARAAADRRQFTTDEAVRILRKAGRR